MAATHVRSNLVVPVISDHHSNIPTPLTSPGCGNFEVPGGFVYNPTPITSPDVIRRIMNTCSEDDKTSLSELFTSYHPQFGIKAYHDTVHHYEYEETIRARQLTVGYIKRMRIGQKLTCLCLDKDILNRIDTDRFHVGQIISPEQFFRGAVIISFIKLEHDLTGRVEFYQRDYRGVLVPAPSLKSIEQFNWELKDDTVDDTWSTINNNGLVRGIHWSTLSESTLVGWNCGPVFPIGDDGYLPTDLPYVRYCGKNSAISEQTDKE